MSTATLLDPPGVANPAETVPSFRLVRRGAVLRSMRHTQPSYPVVTGDVAEIGGCLYARCMIGSGLASVLLPDGCNLDFDPYKQVPIQVQLDNRIVTGYSGDSGDHNLMSDCVVLDARSHIDGPVEQRIQSNLAGWLTIDPEMSADKEIKRFLDDWPTIAGMLGIESGVRASSPFAPGRVRRQGYTPNREHAIVNELDWKAYLDRHAMGDYGTHGRFSDEPLTSAEIFTLPRQPVNRISDHAVRTGSGLIRSSYPIPAEMNAKLNPHPWASVGYAQAGFVEVVTCIGHGAPETLMTLRTEGIPPPPRKGR